MLVVSGEVTARADDALLILRADGTRLDCEYRGTVPRGRKRLVSAARHAARAGMDVRVTDHSGRRLVELGPSVRSPLGQLVAGTAHARPSVRGLFAAARGHVR